MNPAALLITMNRYKKVRELLKKQLSSAPSCINVRLVLAKNFDQVFEAMREPVDLIALDGHGFVCQGVPFFGTDNGKNGVAFTPSRLRGANGRGIVAPIVALSFCHGGTTPFQDSVRASCDASALILGSRHQTDYADSAMIYPALFAALAELGTSPTSDDTRQRMFKASEAIGRGWHSEQHLVPVTSSQKAHIGTPPDGAQIGRHRVPVTVDRSDAK